MGLFESNEDKLAKAKLAKAEATRLNAEANAQRAGARYQAQAAKDRAAEAEANAQAAEANAQAAQANAQTAQANARKAEADARMAEVAEQRKARLQQLLGKADWFVEAVGSNIGYGVCNDISSYVLPTDKEELIKVCPMMIEHVYKYTSGFKSKFENNDSPHGGGFLSDKWKFSFDPEKLEIEPDTDDFYYNNCIEIKVSDPTCYNSDPLEYGNVLSLLNSTCDFMDKYLKYYDVILRKLKEWELVCVSVCPDDPRAVALKERLSSEVYPLIEKEKGGFEEKISGLRSKISRLEELAKVAMKKGKEELAAEEKEEEEDLKKYQEDLKKYQEERDNRFEIDLGMSERRDFFIPASIKLVPEINDSFSSFEKPLVIRVNNAIPPKLEEIEVSETATLVVPTGSKEAYANHPKWCQFVNIQEADNVRDYKVAKVTKSSPFDDDSNEKKSIFSIRNIAIVIGIIILLKIIF